MGLLAFLTVVAPFGCAVHAVVCLFKGSLWPLVSERDLGSLQARGEGVPAAWLCRSVLALGWSDSPRPQSDLAALALPGVRVGELPESKSSRHSLPSAAPRAGRAAQAAPHAGAGRMPLGSVQSQSLAFRGALTAGEAPFPLGTVVSVPSAGGCHCGTVTAGSQLRGQQSPCSFCRHSQGAGQLFLFLRCPVPKEICLPLKAQARMGIYSAFPPARKESVLVQFHAFQVGFGMRCCLTLGREGVQGVCRKPQKAGSYGRDIAAPSALPHRSLKCKSLIQSWSWWFSPHFWHCCL